KRRQIFALYVPWRSTVIVGMIARLPPNQVAENVSRAPPSDTARRLPHATVAAVSTTTERGPARYRSPAISGADAAAGTRSSGDSTLVSRIRRHVARGRPGSGGGSSNVSGSQYAFRMTWSQPGGPLNVSAIEREPSEVSGSP